MAEWLQWLESHYGLSPELQANLFYTLGVILLLALVPTMTRSTPTWKRR